MTDEYKPIVTYNESGKALVETCGGDINHPADYSFATVNDFIHSHDRTFEELQALCLGMAVYIENLERGENDEDVKKHWYSFSFSGIHNASKLQCNASTYIGYADKFINQSRILYAKEAAGVSVDAVLLDVSYLGYMTKDHFLR